MHLSNTRAGLVLFGLLSLTDVVMTFVTSPNEGPPPSIVISGFILGVVSLVLIALVLRTGSRALLAVLVACRVASALTAVPAFLIDGVPGPFVVLAATFCVLTVVACVFVTASWSSRPT
ncbi:MAG: hypothetical protein QOD90_2997 [Mycobacterium sp.]|jgi:hypothetical protein|nr:hypothetical protein [Mycobacterium sp.]